jgi:hypothetical protein
MHAMIHVYNGSAAAAAAAATTSADVSDVPPPHRKNPNADIDSL